MGRQKMTEEEFKLKYKNGRVCTICKVPKDIEEFRFNTSGDYRGNCNDCNKLITYIQYKRKKGLEDEKYLKNLIEHHMVKAERIKIIKRYIKKTDTQIAKIIMKTVLNER